ncbi:TetR/AcrR family transcriptional regulator [Paracoccus aminophilus]|uniref:Transcriptional regulator, TetR family n=1 Tax=Paracoccus aminophilus JCM 7686 TaxID=1367847 RepID=S5XKL3_PARAH|nr:TetR/AcrR family transcriptional regulator [Paracoccus aminophilus]AGT07759.1 transcriptional regulator, TetR family [Paracoccus aminophilus JCM 7686]
MARGSYHHGNLKQALVEAATEVVAHRGPLAFTLSEVARSAGVSAAAVYRHFSGRDELLAEVARQGFVIFCDRLRAARDSVPAESEHLALEKLWRVGTTYLEMATENQGFYRAMYASGLDHGTYTAMAAAAEGAYSLLFLTVREVLATLPEARRPDPIMVSNHLWALTHGVIELFSGATSFGLGLEAMTALLYQGGLTYLRGLGISDLPELQAPSA